MKNKFVPLDKRTKKKQREYYAAERRDWEGLNQVTKKQPNQKAYNRKKSGQWNDYAPCLDFYFLLKMLIQYKNSKCILYI